MLWLWVLFLWVGSLWESEGWGRCDAATSTWLSYVLAVCRRGSTGM